MDLAAEYHKKHGKKKKKKKERHVQKLPVEMEHVCCIIIFPLVTMELVFQEFFCQVIIIMMEGEGEEERRPVFSLQGEALEDALGAAASLSTQEQRREFYRNFLKAPHRRVDVRTACAMWEVLLPPEVPWAKAWCEFVSRRKRGPAAVVSLDEWRMLLEFALSIDETFSNHNINEAWPSLIDEFVEEQRVRTTHVGLRNQGATCFLNSLLQTLFIAPEFRRALFAWRPPPTAGAEGSGGGGGGVPQGLEDSVPFQLQRLFGAMHRARGGCLTTKALTHAFGWKDADSFRQHDVLELLQVLLDALEGVSDELSALFNGSALDFVRCLRCGRERAHSTPFVNLSVDIRGCDTLRKALENHARPETLDGPNAVFCDRCGASTPSAKGSRITALPELLFVHLGRFTFDRESQQRVKINSPLRFPFFLDSACLGVRQEEPIDGAVLETKACMLEAEIAKHFQLAEDAQKLSDSSAAFHRMVVSVLQEDLETLTGGSEAATRPPLYELFSVLVHAGSAHGGHYYALAKSFERGSCWFSFNDSHVTEVNASLVCKTFGSSGEQGYSSGANAYLLAYRKISARNVFQVDNVPPYILGDEEESMGFVAAEVRSEGSFDMAAADEEEFFMDDDYDEMEEEEEIFEAQPPQLRLPPGTIEANLWLLPALDSPRDTLFVSSGDSFSEFFSAVVAALHLESPVRIRLFDPESRSVSNGAPLLPTTRGSVIDAIEGSSRPPQKASSSSLLSINLLVETERFPALSDTLVEVLLVSDREATPISKRFLFVPKDATVKSLKSLLAESWNKLWPLQARDVSAEKITVLKCADVSNPASDIALRSCCKSAASALQCTVSAPGVVLSSCGLRPSEPTLKIKKR